MYVFLNGKFVKKENAKISLDDSSFLYGYGAYETLRARNGNVEYLDQHLKRLEHSLDVLLLPTHYSNAVINDTIKELMNKNKLENAKIRITVTKQTFLITGNEFNGYDKKYYESGSSLIVYATSRVLPEAKTTSCANQRIIKKLADNEKAVDGIIVEKEIVKECATSNIFGVRKGIVYTPKTGILAGVTKNVLIKIAKKQGIKIIEEDFNVNFLLSCSECFITSALKWVMPVVKIDDKIVGNGKLGKITKKLMDLNITDKQ